MWKIDFLPFSIYRLLYSYLNSAFKVFTGFMNGNFIIALIIENIISVKSTNNVKC